MENVALADFIKQKALDFGPQTLAFRRHLHQYPELSFQERETAAFISSELHKAAIPHRCNIGGHGIRALVEGSGPGLTFIRADMDALPITEETGLSFSSSRPGIMHACGHDSHSAMVFTAGLIIQALKAEAPQSLPGTLALLFQPAEELAPGGARAMITDGVFRNMAPPGAIYGQHVNPGLPTGVLGFRPGMMMAGVDDLIIKIRGRGGHAAAPHLLADPVHAAAQVIIALQSLVSRSSNPETPTVLSFGKFVADGAFNIIPDAVEMRGTFRTVDKAWRALALARIGKICQSIAEAFDCSAELEIIEGYPPVKNHPELNEFARSMAVEYLGPERVVDLPLVMWAEDFAYYGEHAPACFYNLGISKDTALAKPLHNARLDLDEEALATGAGFMAWLAVRDLQRQAGLEPRR